MDLISIVVPFFNEEESILNFCDFIENHSICKICNLEIIFVDDGSTDNTSKIISSYKFINIYKIKIVVFSKNFGSHAAIRAGILNSSGIYCTYISVDLQEPIDMINIMYNNIIKGFDAIYIEKKSVKVGVMERLFSLTYASLIRKFAVSNYGAGGINNIMVNKKIINYLNNNVEINSSIILQIINSGFKHYTVFMTYNERKHGKSKWTFEKKTKLFIDSFVAFSFMPIRVVSTFGIIISIIGIVLSIYTLINRLCNPDFIAGYTTLVILILFGFGVTNISLGIIAEYLWRTFDSSRNRPAFILSNIIEIKG